MVQTTEYIYKQLETHSIEAMWMSLDIYIHTVVH